MGCCYTVASDKVGVVEKFGKFSHFGPPGLNCILPGIYYIAGEISNRVQQLDVKCESKTHDDVFVHVGVTIQYAILQEKMYQAFYRLENPREQINAYVYDVVRAEIPKLKLDDVFTCKEEIAVNLKKDLDHKMSEYGYNIIQTLITDIEPNQRVRHAMNEINAHARLLKATEQKAEADKMLVIKRATADAESMRLAGEGVARQRQAIIDGLKGSVTSFQEAIKDSTSTDVMELVLITQYFDTLKEVGAATNNRTVFMPHAPSNLDEIMKQIKGGFM
eukprot:CAMPEP_0115042636 /NCGR_PEP_ID=MMETSP0216-20121206/46383_1 /TAXON_ID=223996 /ORGANISM="Protocruzia adherens, Strain Boccale" /LENGTH=275 /DNA_ID=CAMNT_0002424787 /DNA_START=37 /DNA_END=864 /DNA_ORIENTATION=+